MIPRRLQLIMVAALTVLAFATRMWWLDQAPKGALIDEAHYGYIAYSLLETGKDEHGVSHPLIFKGFGDQKLPVYAYTLVPFIKWLGLTTTAVRLPSVLAGSLLVPVLFWLAVTLGMSGTSSLVVAALTAVTPWTFILSRFAFESNLALLFFAVGLVCMVKATRSKPVAWLGLAAIMSAATWYTYIAYRPVTLLVAFLFLGYVVVKRLISIKAVSFFFLLLGVLIGPLFHPAIVGTSTARLNQVGIFTDEGVVMEVNESRTYCDTHLPHVLCYALWNKPTVVSKKLAQRFMHVYSPQFMATQGDGQLRYLSPENFGQLLLIVYPLFVLGLVALLFQVEDNDVDGVARWLLVVGLVVAPLPAILAGEPQKIRLSALVPFVILSCAYGWKLFQEIVPNQTLRKTLNAGLGAVFCFSTLTFLIHFYTIHTVKYDLDYQSYLPEVFTSLESIRKPEIKVFIKPFFSDPIMAYAYYTKVDPRHYQSAVVLGPLEPSGFQHAVKLDNYEVSNDPLLNIGCKAIDEGYPALYVTNEDFKDATKAAEYTSTTGAVYYAYAYDANQYAVAHSEQCLH